MLEATTEIRERTVKSKGHVYKQILIFLPPLLAKDSQFPFKPGDSVRLIVEDGRLIVEKA